VTIVSQFIHRMWRVRSAPQHVLLALSASMFGAAAFLAWLHLSQGPPAQRVHVRWAPTVSISERVQTERAHGLVNGVALEGRTWQYFLRKRSRSRWRWPPHL